MAKVDCIGIIYCQDLIYSMYSPSTPIELFVLHATWSGPPLVRVRQRSDLPLRVCLHFDGILVTDPQKESGPFIES